MGAKEQCIYRNDDAKRRPVSQEYVATLENRVAWLESFIKRVRDAPPEGREEMLAEVSFQDHLGSPPARKPGGQVSVRPPSSHLQLGPEGSLIYHGPTSIFPATICPAFPTVNPAPANVLYLDDVADHFGLDEDAIAAALHTFFKWQYPYFMFIYREAFLREHYGSGTDSKYWSPALLYAVCALGSSMLSGTPHGGIGDRFFGAAESILMVSGLNQPRITSIQAFLCLAFYEVGRGNLSKGWAFSGTQGKEQ